MIDYEIEILTISAYRMSFSFALFIQIWLNWKQMDSSIFSLLAFMGVKSTMLYRMFEFPRRVNKSKLFHYLNAIKRFYCPLFSTTSSSSSSSYARRIRILALPFLWEFYWKKRGSFVSYIIIIIYTQRLHSRKFIYTFLLQRTKIRNGRNN